MSSISLSKKRSHLFVIIAIVSFIVVSCSSPDPIKIGLLAGLTGRVADLGIAGRDGASFAVEQFNSRGGLNGRPVQLVTRNDKQNESECKKAVEELIQEGVVAIVGPMTSSMALVTVPLIDKHGILTISPTVSSNKLVDLDDSFLRIMSASAEAASKTAHYLYLKKDSRKLFVIYDLSNRAYTESWYDQLRSDFESLGGEVSAANYRSAPGYNFLELVKGVTKEEMDSLVILANAMDTAMISQQLKKMSWKKPVMVSEWATTKDLLEFGGAAVEGIEIFHSFDRNNKSSSYLQFSEKFLNRFGYSAGFASAYAYNAVNIILSTLKKNSDQHNLKDNILAGGPYQGVQRTIQFNKFGDVMREYTLLKIHDGKLETL